MRRPSPPGRICHLSPTPGRPADRTRLYDAIERRLHQMMRDGFLDEVRRLHARGDLNAALPAIRSVGYRQLWEHLARGEPLESAVQRAIFATRHLARRQLIWLRSDTDLQCVDALESSASAHMERSIALLTLRMQLRIKRNGAFDAESRYARLRRCNGRRAASVSCPPAAGKRRCRKRSTKNSKS